MPSQRLSKLIDAGAGEDIAPASPPPTIPPAAEASVPKPKLKRYRVELKYELPGEVEAESRAKAAEAYFALRSIAASDHAPTVTELPDDADRA
jgi:hypothetical protein